MLVLFAILVIISVNSIGQVLRIWPTHPFLKVMLQHRDATEGEVIGEPRGRDSTPCPTASSDGISSAPKSVPKVIYVPAQAEQPALVDLALVLGIFLPCVSLDLGAKF